MAIPVLRPVDMGAQQINNAADPTSLQDVATKNYADGIKTNIQAGVQNTAYDYAADTGAANAFVVTLSPVPTLTTGLYVAFKAANANSGASTLNVNSLGAKTIKKTGGATDLANGDISIGQLVVVMYDGTNFQMVSTPGTAGSGGGGTTTLSYPDTIPASPTTWDDEFNAGSTLNAKWTAAGTAVDGENRIGAGTSATVNTTAPSWLRARIVNSSGNNQYIISQSSVPSAAGAFDCTMKFSMPGIIAINGVYLYFMDNGASGGTNGIRACVEFGGAAVTGVSAVATWSTKDAGTWTFSRNTKLCINKGTFFIHVSRDGSNNWRMWYSLDGIAWIDVIVGTYAKTFTIDHFAISLGMNNVGTTQDAIWAVDWIRFNWLTLP